MSPLWHTVPSKRHTQLPTGLTHFSPVHTHLAKHFNHVWEHRRGHYCVAAHLAWSGSEVWWQTDLRSVSPHLYSYYFLLAYEKLFLQSVQLNILLLFYCYLFALIFIITSPERTFSYYSVFHFTYQCNYCTVCFSQNRWHWCILRTPAMLQYQLCVQYDSGELGVWVSPIGAHWIDKYALYPILIRCVNAIYMIYSQ